MILSPEKKEEYLKHPTMCPYCGCDDLDLDMMVAFTEEAPNGAQQHIYCMRCDAGWTDLYKLVGIREDD